MNNERTRLRDPLEPVRLYARRVVSKPATVHDRVRGPITTALLLAAGTGTRLQPLTDSAPKCLTEMNGEPILGRLVRCLIEQGFRRLVVAVGYLDERIREYLHAHARNLAVDFVNCRDYATTNNIYSLWLARERVREPFVLIESDLVFDSHLLGPMRVPNRIAVARFEAPMSGTTVSLDASGRVVSFQVGTGGNGRDRMYKTVNLYSLSRSVWQEVVRRLDRRITNGNVHDYYEVVFAEMVADGTLPLQAVHFDAGQWHEIDTLEDLREADRLFSGPRKPRESWGTSPFSSGDGS